MTHNRWKEWIQLSLYRELTEEEERSLQEHLNGCEDCREEMEKFKRLHQTVSDFAPQPGDPQLLREAREKLFRSLRSVPRKESLRDRLRDILYGLNRPVVKAALAASGSFVVGIALSYLFLRPASEYPVQKENPAPPVALTGETRISNVRFLDANNASGQLDFTFDAVRPVHMKGNIHDEQVQKVLTYAILNEENPGVRLRSIDAVAGQRTVDKDIKNALIAAVKNDVNAGVRKESLRALQNFPLDEDIQKTLLFVLTHDKNPGLRISAINLLDSLRTSNLIPEKDLREVFKSTLQTDDNNYIRLRAKAALEEIRQ